MLNAALGHCSFVLGSMALGAALMAIACGPGTGSLDTGSGTEQATEGETESTGASATTAPMTSGPLPTTAADDTSTDSATGGEMGEYTGFWSTGFGIPYFTPCGEDEAWYAEGLPGFEVCDPDPFYLRVRGMVLPPYEGDPTPRIEVLEILEGPCTGGSCDGSEPIGECESFDVLCETGLNCDLLAQDCEVAEKCMPWANDGGMAWNATRCSPVEPEVAPLGDPCTVVANPWSGHDDCALGAVCWNADPETLQGVCVALCNQALASDPACTMGTSCMPLFARGDDPAGLCL